MKTRYELLKEWSGLSDEEFLEVVEIIKMSRDEIDKINYKDEDFGKFIIALIMYGEVPVNELNSWETVCDFFDDFTEEEGDFDSEWGVTIHEYEAKQNGVFLFVSFSRGQDGYYPNDFVLHEVKQGLTSEQETQLKKKVDEVLLQLKGFDVNLISDEHEYKEMIRKLDSFLSDEG